MHTQSGSFMPQMATPRRQSGAGARAVVGAEILLGKINSLLSLEQTYPAMWEAADTFIGELTLS